MCPHSVVVRSFDLVCLWPSQVIQCVCPCTGDVSRMRVDAELQVAQAVQERDILEDKLAQLERNTKVTLNSREQSHREQLEAERRDKVQYSMDT